MKRSAWWFGIAMLVGVSFAHGQDAQFHPPFGRHGRAGGGRLDGGPER